MQGTGGLDLSEMNMSHDTLGISIRLTVFTSRADWLKTDQELVFIRLEFFCIQTFNFTEHKLQNQI